MFGNPLKKQQFDCLFVAVFVNDAPSLSKNSRQTHLADRGFFLLCWAR
jgi:hypothetical protein